MRRLLLPLCLAFFCLTGSASAFAAEQLLVKYEANVSTNERGEIRRDLDLRLEDSFSLVPRLEVVSLPADETSGVIRELRDTDGVLYAVRDRIRSPQALPGDPLFPSQWGLHNTGQLIESTIWGTTGVDIEAEEAWATSLGSKAVTVAVIDSGIDTDHPDLEANIWTNPGEIAGNGKDDDQNGYVDDVHGWDFVDGDKLPEDTTGHGSHVSGIIGARANNSRGVSGVAPNVSIVPLRACSSSGCPVSATLAALQYAVDNEIGISNNSYGSTGFLQPEYDAIKEAGDLGHLFVASAGNASASNDNPATANYPASYDIPSVVSVAAHTPNDELASFSNYGQSVDIAAPGTSIISTGMGGGYVWMDGTSMASPFVAGVAALIRSRRPGFSQSELLSALLSGRTPVAGSWDGKTSSGRMLSAGRALGMKPLTPVFSKAPAAVSTSSVSFSFFGEAGIPFLCSLDGADPEPCSSPVSLSGIPAGPHTFSVRHRDPYGALSDPVTHSWQVSSVSSPVIAPVAVWSKSQALTISLSGPGALSCRLDGAAWESCTGTVALSAIGAGRHVFEAFSTLDGEQSAVSRISWTVDLDLPTGSARRSVRGRSFLLRSRASDPSSPVKKVEISGSRARPLSGSGGYTLKAYKPQLSISGPRVPRWVRFWDSADNPSAWVRVLQAVRCLNSSSLRLSPSR